MNNDISTDLKFISGKNRTMPVKNSQAKVEVSAEETCNNSDNFKNSMTFLGNMGCVQVNLDKSNLDKNVAKSVKEFLNDPDYAVLYTELCDDLVNKGYSLENAINCTDNIFLGLKDKNTYEQ